MCVLDPFGLPTLLPFLVNFGGVFFFDVFVLIFKSTATDVFACFFQFCNTSASNTSCTNRCSAIYTKKQKNNQIQMCKY